MTPIDCSMFQFNRGYTGFEDPHFITSGRLSDFVSSHQLSQYMVSDVHVQKWPTVRPAGYKQGDPGGCWWRLRDLS